MEIHEFKEELYPFSWKLIIIESKDEIKTKLSDAIDSIEIESISIIEDGDGWTIVNNNVGVVIINKWLFNIGDFIKFITTIRHEVHHLSAGVFTHICEEIDRLDNETFLYLNDYFFKRILSKLLTIQNDNIIIKNNNYDNTLL